MKGNKNLPLILPILSGFFVMGFCDVVGIANSYAKQDFALSETVAGFIPSMVFIWFLLLSIPAAKAMNRTGRKRMVQISNIVTFFGMLLPFIHYSLATCMLAFVMLGIGNTILQVSLNPLLTNVVNGDSLTSSLTAGQVIKAVSSFCGPFIAAFAAGTLGNWKYLFPIYAAITLISALWLQLTPITEEAPSQTGSSSTGSAFALLKDKTILLLFFGIFFIVGMDVGVNTVAPKLLIERSGWTVERAGYGSSVYFICRTIGAFLGVMALAKINERSYLMWNMILATASIIALFFAQSTISILIFVGALGFFGSSVFSIIYSLAMKARPDKINEISGLLLTGITGGAVIPPLMGLMSDALGNQTGSLIVIGICILYLLGCSVRLKLHKAE